MAADPGFAGPAALAELVRSREATSRELVELFLVRTEALDPRLNAFRTVMADQALAEADGMSSHDGALARCADRGQGRRRRRRPGAHAGLREANWPAPMAHDAEVVRRLRAVGAIRIPAACCGLVGMKPTRGRVSSAPNPPGWLGLSTYGALARTVSDSALLLDVMHGSLPGDPLPAPPFAGSYREAAASTPPRLRIAVSAKLPPGLLARVAGDERSAWERTAATLVGAGHDVSARDPDYGLAQVLFAQFWVRGVHEDVRAVADASQLEGSTRQMAGAGRVVVPDRRRASLLRARERAGARLAGPIAAHRDSELDAPAVRPVHLCTVTALEPGGHRERLITAMAVSIADKGYRDTTVADVVRVARTSRRNFYEHFVDRDACFLALFDVTNAALMAEIAAAVDPLLTLDEQVDIAVDTYIASVLDRPELYHSFVRELPGLREAGAERAQAALEGFAQLLIGLVDSGRRARPELALRPLDMDTAIIIVGGLRELLVIALQRGRDMRELRASAGHAIKLILIGKLL